MAGGDDGPDHAEAAQQDARWKADRPGDPGAEGMNAAEAGEPSPGPDDDAGAGGPA
jgi:hypothetical protein